MMTTEQFELAMQLESIFMPNARVKRNELYEKSKIARFVHYTSAEAAINIFNTKQLWLRSTTCMADYREVMHGFDMLNAFFRDPQKKDDFINSLDTCAPNVAQEAITLFNQWWNDIQFNTFIASISEHDDKEDQHGRLSMWRAFGGNSARVAMVFNIPWMTEATSVLNVIFSPVAYLDEREVYDEINHVINLIEKNQEFLSSVERSTLLAYVFNMLVAGVTCLKHEGFREEREWRVIYSPKRWPSKVIVRTTQTINGVPQIIHKLPLDKSASDALADLDMAKIFDRLIIGPTPYPMAQREAFIEILNRMGVEDAENRIFISGIPIRS